MKTRPAAIPFLFGDDLRQPAAARQAVAELSRLAEEQQRAALEREAIEREAFERGREAGRREADAEIGRARCAALERIALEAGRVLATVDGRAATVEDEALSFFGTLAAKVAGRALAREPLAAIADAAREAFRHLRGVPHLVARVHESLVEDVDLALRAMARDSGFEGRIVVIGSDQIVPGDARLDWADGAVVAERGALDAAVESVLTQVGREGPADSEIPWSQTA